MTKQNQENKSKSWVNLVDWYLILSVLNLCHVYRKTFHSDSNMAIDFVVNASD